MLLWELGKSRYCNMRRHYSIMYMQLLHPINDLIAVGRWGNLLYGHPWCVIQQGGRKISVIIVSDDYLCYKEQKIPYIFFLILIFNELFKFKTSDERQLWKTASPLLWTVRASTFSLRSHKDPFAFDSVLPRSSDQKIRMKCYLILRKLHRTRKIFTKIILRVCKINLLMWFFSYYL